MKRVIVRSPSSSPRKLSPIRRAWSAEHPRIEVVVRDIPVELQSRSGSVNAQPIGKAETIRYAQLREDALQRQDSGPWDLDISIESGAIDRKDVAVGLLNPKSGQSVLVLSTR